MRIRDIFKKQFFKAEEYTQLTMNRLYMPNYAKLRDHLDARITLMEKIAVIDDLRNNKEKSATIEQEKLLQEREDATYTEEIALMLQAKSNARAEHGIDYQPVLITE